MLDIQRKTLDRALATLAALNCQFVVREPDGTQHGDMTPFLPKPAPATHPRIRRNDFSAYRIRPLLSTMQVGDVQVFAVREEDADKDGFVEALRSAVTAHATHALGTGAVTTCIAGDTVQALRLV